VKTITIHTSGKPSRIVIGEKLQNLSEYVHGRKCVVITDASILEHYRDQLPDWPIITVGQGEQNKTTDTLNEIFGKLVDLEADRSHFIVGIGGGIVCDVAGFAASVYMRGLPFGFVSTTLLSQVDASVGGKNGVNFRKYKNMLGVFSQPEFVICDPRMLQTLKKNVYISGFAEIVKAGAIRSESLIGTLERNTDKALDADPEVMEDIIYRSVRIKADIVETDEKEKGERRKLNFGHTFAHAFENMTDIIHGEAVSIGMVLASRLSVALGYLPEADATRITNLLERLQLPVKPAVDIEQALAPMKKDKKREGDSVHMVLLKHIGEAIIEKIPYNKLEELIHDLRQYK
jgi:3-dehydroquinate synthase